MSVLPDLFRSWLSRPRGIRANWWLYAIEASLLACVVVAACVFGVIVEHPASPIRAVVTAPILRRSMLGLAMAVVTLAVVYSPIGRRSGPHLNPAMTLTFLRLRRITTIDAVGFIAGQFVGGVIGLSVAATLLGRSVGDIRYGAIVPGSFGLTVAWFAEGLIAMLLVCMVFTVNRTRLVRYTGCFAALLGWLFVTFEAPLSGTGLNAARTFAASLFADLWTGWWVYFTAPPAGMLAGVELLRWFGLRSERLCGKLTHDPACFFRCGCVARVTARSS
jgi:aquaporin Z